MADEDDIDIYGDLADFGEKSSDDCSENTLELKKKCTYLEDKVVNLEKELESLRTIKNTLETNLSSLVKTAKTEIARKDRMIAELRAELENSLFRRNKYRIPKVNRNNDSNNAPIVKTTPSISNPTPKVEAVEIHVNNIEPVYLKPFTAVKKDDNDDDDDDGGEQIYQPNKFASTVYGERLRKKIMEQEAAEKLQKVQLKLVALASVKTEIKEEPDTNPININKNNKENQFHEIATNESNVENPMKKSLKRSNDEALNGHCDKRKKLINHRNENIDKRVNNKSENIDIPPPHEPTAKKINHQLEPIESRLINISQQHNENPVIQKNSDEPRDNYRDKYRKRCSNSRSKSRDSSNHSDRRKKSSSRSRESNRRRDTGRSDHHHSGSDRDIQSKYENRRDHRDKITRNSNSGSKRVIDLRNEIDHPRRHRTDKRTDRRYEAWNEKEPHNKRKRSSRSQHNPDDSHSKDTSRNTTIIKRDISKSSTGTFSDKSNDSITLTKYGTETLPEIVENIEVEIELATNLNSLKECEIIGSPVSTPQEIMVNNVVSNKELDETSVDTVLHNHLLLTLSIETPKVDIATRNCPKSPQEENIENIAGFIRNFTCHSVPDEPSSTIKNELPGDKTDSPCNTTRNVAEALECEANKTATIVSCEKTDIPETIIEPCINNNEGEQIEPPSSTQSPSKFPETEEDVYNLPSKLKATKVDTISTNNVSTSYADVLSKYVRKKKRSITGDSDSVMPENDSSSLTGKLDEKDVIESGDTIDNESVLPTCSEEQRDNVEKHDAKQEKKDETSVALVHEPIIELPCNENVTLSKDTENADGVRKDVMDQKEIDAVEYVNTKIETSGEPAKLPGVESQINHVEIEIVRDENDTNHSAKEEKKLTSIEDALVPQCSNRDNDSVDHVVCTPTNTSEELRSTQQETVEINDKIIDEKEKNNKSVELKIKKDLDTLSEPICEQKCEDNIVKDTEGENNKCKKLVSTLPPNEKRIVVARRKKRPVQLTNSSSSLTVVLSAYNVNNNRICKSRMKTPVTLSDT